MVSEGIKRCAAISTRKKLEMKLLNIWEGPWDLISSYLCDRGVLTSSCIISVETNHQLQWGTLLPEKEAKK